MRPPLAAFTLVELLVSIAIIAMLIGLLAPQASRIQARAHSVKCANNLRQIGLSVQMYAQDNDNRFPAIESMPSDPVYDQDDTGKVPRPMHEVLSHYGLTKAALQCPADLRKLNYFAREGSSYQWRNIVDDEVVSAPKIYGRRGVRNPRTAWLLLATDYDRVHSGRSNRLYADGHVVAF